ncbi:phosphonatase-like hydrolase [Streptomyces avicenniae]|uniref:phosphonatase-like hydrolase n=1 Tax=Streptomyces avicenniae TaxID=500153 RepID=UPI000699433E|nr:phosphonatase-like hydrolase [Streptomyces avicenniae]
MNDAVPAELAVLDIAGTTVEEHGAVYEALADAVAAASPVPPSADAIQRWMGADKREAIRSLLPGEPDEARVGAVFTDFRARLDRAYRDRPPTPLPGVPEALAALRAAGVRVALTTGFDRQVTDALLASLGWDGGTVDAVTCADDVPAGRPAPYMIFRAMEATGVRDVSRVLVAGDTTRDLRAGVHAGAAYVVGVLTGQTPAAVLGAERHTHLLPGVADIPALLGIPYHAQQAA